MYDNHFNFNDMILANTASTLVAPNRFAYVLVYDFFLDFVGGAEALI